MDFQRNIEPSDVQYMGMPAHSQSCLLAVDTIVNSKIPPRKASLVTHIHDRRSVPIQQEHLFVFWDWNSVPMTVVHSGFASGYPGEGPRSFSLALCMIWDTRIPVNWIPIRKEWFDAIEGRRMSSSLIEQLQGADDEPLTFPRPDWIHSQHETLVQEHGLWQQFHDPKLNGDWLDRELSKRCLRVFETDQEAAIVNAYKLIEECLRGITKKEQGYGVNLINEAFDPERNGVLINQNLSKSEQEGIHQLFVGAFKIFRNPRGHRFLDVADPQFNIELIYLTDLLLKLIRFTSDKKRL